MEKSVLWLKFELSSGSSIPPTHVSIQFSFLENSLLKNILQKIAIEHIAWMIHSEDHIFECCFIQSLTSLWRKNWILQLNLKEVPMLFWIQSVKVIALCTSLGKVKRSNIDPVSFLGHVALTKESFYLHITIKESSCGVEPWHKST